MKKIEILNIEDFLQALLDSMPNLLCSTNIIMEEDDAYAILTRKLVEEHKVFGILIDLEMKHLKIKHASQC